MNSYPSINKAILSIGRHNYGMFAFRPHPVKYGVIVNLPHIKKNVYFESGTFSDKISAELRKLIKEEDFYTEKEREEKQSSIF